MEYLKDTWVCPGTFIYPLKVWGEGALGKIKKRKINLVKSTCEEPESCRPSIAGPFEEIGIYLRAIRELVSGLAQGTENPSTTHHSYVF